MQVTLDATSAPLLIDIRPARMGDIYPILALHREAFADKFGAAFGARGMSRGVEAMAEAWRRQGSSALRGMLVAYADEQVIGTITLRTWEMGSDDSGAAELAFQQVLGLWGAFRSIFTLSLLDHQIGRDEGYITDVAVLSSYRRRGVARALLASAEDDARARRKRYLGLYVSAANRGAQTLYASAGFDKRQTRRSVLAGLLLHQIGWVYMRKDLA
ncbi:MAG TPA: N-acetyltransferase [Roseiflexaceae bacterium]|nr:N-acetyltransferase [Roseiflexaceae bacterium]